MSIINTRAPTASRLVDAGGMISRTWLEWLRRLSSDESVVRDTRAARAGYAPADYPSRLYYETDTTLFYLSNGTAWVFATGTVRKTSATVVAFLATLGTNDQGLRVEVTDYAHTLWWSGANSFFAAGDDGSGYISMFVSTPIAGSWAECDGAAVDYLKADGTTGSFTTPDFTTSVYVKLNKTTATIGPTAASGATGNTSGGTPSGTISAIAGTGTTTLTTLNAAGQDVADNLHTHPAPTFSGDILAAHSHTTNTLDLRNTQLIAFFRR